MDPAVNSLEELGVTAKQIGRRLLTIGENRLELLMVEVQEERARILHAVLLTLGVAAFGLLACLTLSAIVVILTWTYSRVAGLVVLTGVYAVCGWLLYRRLADMLAKWQTLAATLDQLRKDRACFAEHGS